MSLDRRCWIEVHSMTGHIKKIYSPYIHDITPALEHESVKLQTYPDEYIEKYKKDNNYPIGGQVDFMGLFWISLDEFLKQYKLPESPVITDDICSVFEYNKYDSLKKEINILSALSEKYLGYAKIVYLIEN